MVRQLKSRRARSGILELLTIRGQFLISAVAGSIEWR